MDVVHLPMLTEADFVTEGFVADFAGERSFAVVRSASVNLQAVRRREHFLAFDAGEGVGSASGRGRVERPVIAFVGHHCAGEMRGESPLR